MTIEHLLQPELQERLKAEGIEKFLDFLGDERLRQKKARMANLLKIANPDEALYREIMLALGYKNNKIQFLELALILPYSEVCNLKEKVKIEKALLYRAGFSVLKEGLPEDFDLSLRMEKSVWHLRGTRPANYPENRIKGISRFLSHSCESGFYKLVEAKIVENYSEAVDRRLAAKLCKEVTKIFTEGETKSVGKIRAMEIFFNIILPFFMVLFEEREKKEMSDFLYWIYIEHPTLSENSVTKTIKEHIFGDTKEEASRVINSVRRYMALIYLYDKILNIGEGYDNS
jgi:hypothetical protein